MTLAATHNVTCKGSGPATLVFCHGFGCDQTMWRHIVPALSARFKVVLFDLAGCGKSDLAAYDRDKYASLEGHASDVVAITGQYGEGPVFFIGHSVGASIGMLAGVGHPAMFAGHVMVSPSPCYINHGDYVGGFNEDDIDALLQLMDDNYDKWSASVAPMIMGAAGGQAMQQELNDRFCRNDRAIARHFARVTFRGDHRALVPLLTDPVLVLQSSDDLIAPREVGEYMHRHLPRSRLQIIHNDGHCPHMTAPAAAAALIDGFILQCLGQAA